MKMFTCVERFFLSHCSVFVSLLHEICFLVMIKMVFLFNSKGYCRAKAIVEQRLL